MNVWFDLGELNLQERVVDTWGLYFTNKKPQYLLGSCQTLPIYFTANDLLCY